MKKLTFFLFVLLFSVAFISCEDQFAEEIDNLQTEETVDGPGGPAGSRDNPDDPE